MYYGTIQTAGKLARNYDDGELARRPAPNDQIHRRVISDLIPWRANSGSAILFSWTLISPGRTRIMPQGS